MDLTVIRIKRSREADPIDQISLASKKFRSDSGQPTLCKVATLEDENAPLKAVLKEAVAKLKQEKLLRQEQKNLSYQELYKPKRVTKRYIGKQENIDKQKEVAASSRFKIISHSRGMSDIDEDIYSYLTKSDKYAIEFNDSSKNGEQSQASGRRATDGASAAPAREVEIIEVQHCSSNTEQAEDIICMNDVPMKEVTSQYVYDIYIAARPYGVIDDLNIIEPPVIYNDYDACDSDIDYDSEDSNAEDHYANDYPDEEEEEGDESESEEYIDMDDLQLNLGHMSIGRNNKKEKVASLNPTMEDFNNLFESNHADSDDGSYSAHSCISGESDEEG